MQEVMSMLINGLYIADGHVITAQIEPDEHTLRVILDQKGKGKYRKLHVAIADKQEGDKILEDLQSRMDKL